MRNYIRIGADPEFVYKDQQGVIPAHRHQRYSGAWGTDTYEDVAELRPGYSEDIVDLVSKIHHLMKLVMANQKIAELKWIAGAYVGGYSLGGHIHISTPQLRHYATESRIPNHYSDRHIKEGNLLCSIEDSLLMNILECQFANKEQLQLRRERGYGMRSSWRWQPHGIEYRSVSGSWLASPELALVYFGFAKIGAAVYLALKEREYEMQQILGRYAKPRTPFALITQKYANELFDVLRKELLLSEDCILSIHTYNNIVGHKVPWDRDIKEAWGIK